LTTYRLTLTYNGSDYLFSLVRTNGSAPTANNAAEIIIELDWSSLSGDVFDSFASTYDTGWAVAQILMLTNAIPELNGHTLTEFPIHMIGHSRGGSLVSEVSFVLGTNGIWVDQLTTLDPYPLNNDGNDDFPATVQDAPAQYTYVNTLFADNYWQDLGAGYLLGDPDGEPVSGAYVRQLLNLTGGYDNDHENVHLWYYGTINLNTPANDTGATITSSERANWWASGEQDGTNAGFEYSLIGGANRMSTNKPAGPGFPAIVSGYNQWWDFGAGKSDNRTALPSNLGAWPNLIQFNVVGESSVAAGQTIGTKFYYQYGGASRNLTAQFYLDADWNPYNTNSTLITEISLTNTGVNSVFSNSVNLVTTNVPPGTYAVYGKISDGTHTRYLYAPELVEIAASQQPPVMGIAQLSSTQLVISVSGFPGQTVMVQSSPDLQNWSPVVTNILTMASWSYTNSASSNVSEQFYRAVLVP
jgi:hypothetical protein